MAPRARIARATSSDSIQARSSNAASVFAQLRQQFARCSKLHAPAAHVHHECRALGLDRIAWQGQDDRVCTNNPDPGTHLEGPKNVLFEQALVSSGPIELKVGEPEGVYSPTDVGTGKAKEDKAPLSEIIQVLNERFGTAFTEEDRLFFAQIKARATANTQVIQTALANPLDKFQLGVRKLVEDLMIQRMSENDKIVTRYMDDTEFQRTAFPILAKEIFEAVHAAKSPDGTGS